MFNMLPSLLASWPDLAVVMLVLTRTSPDPTVAVAVLTKALLMRVLARDTEPVVLFAAWVALSDIDGMPLVTEKMVRSLVRQSSRDDKHVSRVSLRGHDSNLARLRAKWEGT